MLFRLQSLDYSRKSLARQIGRSIRARKAVV